MPLTLKAGIDKAALAARTVDYFIQVTLRESREGNIVTHLDVDDVFGLIKAYCLNKRHEWYVHVSSHLLPPYLIRVNPRKGGVDFKVLRVHGHSNREHEVQEHLTQRLRQALTEAGAM